MTDYSSMRQNDLRLAFAAAASVAPIAVSLDVASASVLLTVRVTAANASHSASIYAALATHLASVASASTLTNSAVLRLPMLSSQVLPAPPAPPAPPCALLRPPAQYRPSHPSRCHYLTAVRRALPPPLPSSAFPAPHPALPAPSAPCAPSAPSATPHLLASAPLSLCAS